MTTELLAISYGVSRGRETYGYNIVTLTDESGKKYRAMGGGYDMVGTVFGEWLATNHGGRLLEVAHRAHRVDGVENRTRDSLYGMIGRNGKVCVDGACGLESMRRIAEACSIGVRSVTKGRRCELVGFIVDVSDVTE